MKFKKPRGALLGFGYALIVIAAALFFLVPVFCKGLVYSGVDVSVAALKALITFNFSHPLYTAIAALLCVAVAGLIVYAINSIVKKHGSHLVIFLFSLVAIFASYVLISAYFLADVTLNGTQGHLLDLLIKTNDEMLGKILLAVVLALAVVSNILLVVHMFADAMSMIVTDEVNNLESKIDAEKEQKVEQMVQEKLDEALASQPAVAPTAPVAAEVTVEPVAVEKVDIEDDFEERKERELKLFKECVDSGYFTEYEEIEFPDAIEGVNEEPVYEASVVEEKTAFVRKQSVHVGFTHD